MYQEMATEYTSLSLTDTKRGIIVYLTYFHNVSGNGYRAYESVSLMNQRTTDTKRGKCFHIFSQWLSFYIDVPGNGYRAYECQFD